MLKIGLTGGLGSGKSTVAHIFEVLGVPVYYADTASKKLMDEDENVKASVQKIFGKETYPEGKLDRKYLAKIVFNDEKKLKLLNSIVHPATLSDAALWMEQQAAIYAIKEAALIFESGSDKNLDFVIGVKAPLQLRVQRAVERDNINYDDAMARINEQMDEDSKMNLCDFIIINDEEHLLIEQVIAVHKRFIKLKNN